MPSRDTSRDLTLSIEEEFMKIHSSVSFTLFKGKVCDYDSSRPETAYLSPDQDAVNTFFLRTEGLLRPEVRKVLEEFFNCSVRACILYRVLFMGIQNARQSQTSINQALELVHKLNQRERNNISSQSQIYNSVLEELNKFAALENPFCQETLDQFQLLQEYSEKLERELGEVKQVLDAKLRKGRSLSKVLPVLIIVAGSPVLICLAIPAALAGLAVSIIADDAMASLKNWWLAVRGRFSNSQLEAQCGQLDAADKGNYIIIHDLMTIKRLVTRSRNEVENTRRRIMFLEEAMEDYGSLSVIVHQLKINTACSELQMKDFSEQVVLCCRTIEKARKLVFEKITGEPLDVPVQIFTKDSGSSDDNVKMGPV